MRYRVKAGENGWVTFGVDARSEGVGYVARLTDMTATADRKVLVGELQLLEEGVEEIVEVID